MNVEIKVPEDVARQLEEKWGNVSRRALEAVALEAYRSGAITEAQLQRMLGLSSRWAVEAFLKQVHAYLDYSEADLERDLTALRKATAP